MESNKKNKIAQIIHQFLGNRYSKNTEENVQRWLIEDENDRLKEEASFDYWDTFDVPKPGKKTYRALKKTKSRIGTGKNIIPLHRKLLRVAAVLVPLIIVAATYFYFNSNSNQQRVDLLVVAAGNGEVKQVFLPDSTEVWINSGATIEYPSRFTGKERLVKLSGEAYFTVQKDPEHPFIVNTDYLSIKVLGTEFNILAYPNAKRVSTTLNSGKVEIHTSSDEYYILKPNEQLVYEPQSGAIKVHHVKANEISGWINGQLYFSDTSLEEILTTLERRFNISIEMKQPLLNPDEQYTVKFLKNDDIYQIMNILQELTGSFTYEKQGEKIILFNN